MWDSMRKKRRGKTYLTKKHTSNLTSSNLRLTQLR